MKNLLFLETSPYLLQHADNPIHWQPWGQAAFDQAKKENKPVFLSIGYAACHWCHVMAHESFEDPQVADYLNRHFVSIKVDREERPDIDSLYMSAVVHMTGQGGWPLSIFLTPQGEPFFGGTYFPPKPRYGMPSFIQLLQGIKAAWKDERAEVTAVTAQISQAIAAAHSLPEAESELNLAELLNQAVDKTITLHNSDTGGWGSAPKFPQPIALQFLLLQAAGGDSRGLPAVNFTLHEMARGGMADLIGGGFHRYATDPRWLVPHFEKMLYDNAQLSRTYLMAYLQTGSAFFRAVCEDTLDFILREMRLPDGGLIASLDADSEGEEGKYYLWSYQELEQLFGTQDEWENLTTLFQLPEQGNFEGKIILRFCDDVLDTGDDYRSEAFLRTRSILHEQRRKRVPPAADDKVVASWNGLALQALAEAGRYLRQPRYLKAAEALAGFIQKQMYTKKSGLFRTWRNSQPGKSALLEDYAAVILGLLSLYQVSPRPEIYAFAEELRAEMEARFRHPEQGYFDSQADPTLLFRGRDAQDNATPSGNALAAQTLLVFYSITGRPEERDAAFEMLAAAAPLIRRYPTSFAAWLSAAALASKPPETLVIALPESLEMPPESLSTVLSTYQPFRSIIQFTPGSPTKPPGIAQGKVCVDGKITYYLCRNFTCDLPVTNPEGLA